MGVTNIVRNGVLFLILFTASAYGQSLEITFTVSDSGEQRELTAGMDVDATEGFDSAFDQFAPPVPPAPLSDTFDSRIIAGDEEYYRYFRPYTTEEVSYTIAYQVASGPLNIDWSEADLPEEGLIFFRYTDNGVETEVNLRESQSHTFDSITSGSGVLELIVYLDGEETSDILPSPQLISPVDNETGVDLQPTLQWSEIDGADGYILHVNVVNPSEMVIDVESTETSFVPDQPFEPNRDFDWRVRAVKDGVEGEWSTIRRFTSGEGEPTEPDPDADLSILFTVKDSLDERDLVVGLDENATDGFDTDLDQFAPPPPPSGTFDSRIIAGGEDYYRFYRSLSTEEVRFEVAWKIGQGPLSVDWSQAELPEEGLVYISYVNGGDVIDVSLRDGIGYTFDSFTSGSGTFDLVIHLGGTEDPPMIDPPSVEITSGPEPGAVVNVDQVNFSWEGISEESVITGYEVELLGPVEESFATTETNYTFENLTDGEYTFRVRAQDEGDRYSGWADREFSVSLVADPLSAPELITPEDGVVIIADESTIFSWSSVDGASSYQIQFDDEDPIDTGTDTEFELITSTIGEMTWKARALDGDVAGEWSEARTFTVEQETDNQPPTVAIVNGPEDGSTIGFNDPGFVWEGEDEDGEVVLYEVELIGPSSEEFTTEETFHQFEDLENGEYDFRVRAQDNDGAFSEWAQRSFTVDVLPDQLSAPELIAPEDGAVIIADEPTIFNWSSVDGASGYQIQFDEEDPIDTGTDTKFELITSTTGEMTWKSRALDGDAAGEWSETRTFTVEKDEDPPPLPEAPILLAPEGGESGVERTPDFKWNDAEHADSYNLQLSGQPAFDELILEQTGLSETAYSVRDPLNYETEYFWRVRGANETGAGEWSEVWSFTTMAQFAGGDGSKENPFLISSPENLSQIRDYPNYHFIQTEDIDLEGFSLPISISIFRGSYDGNGYYIKNFNSATGGFIDEMREDAILKNVNLVDVSITSSNLTFGSLINQLYSGTVENCHVSGNIGENRSRTVGGIIGATHWESENVLIKNCSFDGVVKGDLAGGLVGSFSNGTIVNSFTDGEIYGFEYVGGITGYNSGEIINSFSNSLIEGYVIQGGITGGNNGRIVGSYFSGEMNYYENLWSYMGGIAGENSVNGIIIDSHTKSLLKGQRYVGGVASVNRGSIINTYSNSEIFGENYVGGIAGLNFGRIEESYSRSNIQGQSKVGGVAGLNDISENSAGYIKNTYSIGNVKGDLEVGGFVGLNESIISHSYTVSTVNGQNDTGIFAGRNLNEISNSYYDSEVANIQSEVGGGSASGIIGLPSDNMQGTSAKEYMDGFDFDSVWLITSTYPAMRWEKESVITDPPNIVFLISPQNESNNISTTPEFKWEPDDWAEAYELYISYESEFNSLIIDTVLTDVSFISNKFLESDREVYWKVRAINHIGKGEWSEIWSFRTIIQAVVKNLELQDLGESIKLSWQFSEADQIEKYNIYKGSSISKLEIIDSVAPDLKEFVKTDINQGTSLFAVTSIYQNGSESDFSNIVSFYNETKTVTDKWQLLSLPVADLEKELENSQVFGFNRVYQQETNLVPGKGYWVRGDSEETIPIRSGGLEEAVLELNRGWNLVGGLVDLIPVESIIDSSGILTAAPVYTYVGDNLEEVAELETSKGYWIFASDTGRVFLSIYHDIETQRKITEGGKSDALAFSDTGRIIFTKEDVEQTILATHHRPDEAQLYRYILPPPAPDPVLDVRTKSGYSLMYGLTEELQIRASDYPVGVRAEAAPDEQQIYRILAIDDEENEVHFNLLPGRQVYIDREYVSLRLERVHLDEVILEAGIDPNYPNPFNPATNIRYRLAETSEVMIDVYDIVGRRVATLVNSRQMPGQYTVQFDGSSLASGVYFLRIQAGSFADIQKLTLIK